MNCKQEGTFAIISAFFVMFSSLINPIISVSISVIILVGYGIYKLYRSKTKS